MLMAGDRTPGPPESKPESGFATGLATRDSRLASGGHWLLASGFWQLVPVLAPSDSKSAELDRKFGHTLFDSEVCRPARSFG